MQKARLRYHGQTRRPTIPDMETIITGSCSIARITNRKKDTEVLAPEPVEGSVDFDLQEDAGVDPGELAEAITLHGASPDDARARVHRMVCSLYD